MNTQEEIDFCITRISEQVEYLAETTRRYLYGEIDKERAGELMRSALTVKKRFEERLQQLQPHETNII